jgi:ferric-dicitrate binding protein FerR (iron transport regulator)
MMAGFDRRQMLLALGGATSLLMPERAFAQEATAGSVVNVRGEARANRAGAARVLQPQGAIFIGDRIATEAGARASLRLGQTTDLVLGERARVTIDQFLMNAGGTITLGGGAILVDRNAGPADAGIQVRSGYGLIATRGTRFFAGPSNGVFGVFVASGRLAVSGGGESVTLSAGEGTDIARPGGKPTPPRAWGQARIDAALAMVR